MQLKISSQLQQMSVKILKSIIVLFYTVLHSLMKRNEFLIDYDEMEKN